MADAARLAENRLLLAKLRQRLLSDDEIVHAVVRFGKEFGVEDFLQAEPDIAPLLDSPDSEIRKAALFTLVSWWQVKAYLKKAIEMMRTDPSDDVRLAAVQSVGGMGITFGDRSVLRPLYQVLMKEDENSFVRASAYNSIRRIHGEPKPTRTVSNFSEITEWGPIEAVRKELEATAND